MTKTSWGDIDPVQAAARVSAPSLPKRFYTTVELAAAEGGLALTLDGRPARTPSKRPLVVPAGRLADAIAAEWRQQGGHIDPASMPATRAANSAIDGVADQKDAVAAEIINFAATDLVCYRAETPQVLCDRQTAAWDPVVEWVARTFGTRPRLVAGIMHVAQPEDLLEALRKGGIGGLSVFPLCGLYTVTTLTGSCFLALALKDGFLDADAVWRAAHVDEDWQIEQWGEDEEAKHRRALRRLEFDAAVLCLSTL